jgi:hypothetical protein
MVEIQYYVKFFSFVKGILNSDEIFQVYINISRSHIKSALEAIESASKGDYRGHAFVVLGHLRDSYYMLDTANENRKVRWYEWLDDKLNGYSSCDSAKENMYKDLFKIASMISYGHKLLGEYENSERWKTKAYNDFEHFAGHSYAYVASPRFNGHYASPASDSEIDNKKGYIERQRLCLESYLEGKTYSFY